MSKQSLSVKENDANNINIVQKRRKQYNLSLDEDPSQLQQQPYQYTKFGIKYHELDADTVIVYHPFIIKKERLELMEEFFRIINQSFSRFLC